MPSFSMITLEEQLEFVHFLSRKFHPTPFEYFKASKILDDFEVPRIILHFIEIFQM